MESLIKDIQKAENQAEKAIEKAEKKKAQKIFDAETKAAQKLKDLKQEHAERVKNLDIEKDEEAVLRIKTISEEAAAESSRHLRSSEKRLPKAVEKTISAFKKLKFDK